MRRARSATAPVYAGGRHHDAIVRSFQASLLGSVRGHLPRTTSPKVRTLVGSRPSPTIVQLSQSSWAQAPAVPRSTTPRPAVSFAHGQRDRADQRPLSQDRSGPFPRRASRAETPVSGNAFPLLRPGTVGSRAWGEPWLKTKKDIPLDGCAAKSVNHAFELKDAANYLHGVLKHQPGSA